MKSRFRHAESGQVYLALAHHANQYVITDGYADREGIGAILGLACEGYRRGLLPLLQMHLDYQVPLNLHLSGTLIETLAWHYPDSFSVIKRLRRAGLLEMVGSAFSQNIMPFFSSEHNLRQINEELWLYRRHLGWDLNTVKTFWVPERVWDTEKLAQALSSNKLLNRGYRYVLLDDRLVYSVGADYRGSAREWFDRGEPLQPDAFSPWGIDGGEGLMMLPISKRLRYLIPPTTPESLDKLSEIFRWLASFRDEAMIAVFGDDLERSAGVGGWDHLHPERYEQFLKWLAGNKWIKPVLIGQWVAGLRAVGTREIERGTFYELAQSWNAGEDYRGWHEDPNCFEHRQYILKAEQALIEAGQRGAEPGLLELGWKHLLHCCYETSWHNFRDQPSRLEAWAAALTSHARSCFVIARAAEWASERDGAAHAELTDIDHDGEEELALKNNRLFAVFSPRWGGRLTYLFDLTGHKGRLVIGNISDDWNLQEELNRYMDCPRNHPGALADAGHEHDQYLPVIVEACGQKVSVSLRNIQPESNLRGVEKQISLSHDDGHLCVRYSIPQGVDRLSAEVCLSPDYHRLLRYGREKLTPFNGSNWRGWSNRSERVWVRTDPRSCATWDKARQTECGHGLNLRITSFSGDFHIDVGTGIPPQQLCRVKNNNGRSSAIGLNADQVTIEPAHNGHRATHTLNLPVTDPHFMRRFLNHNLPAAQADWLRVQSCRVRPLKTHHDRLTIEYDLSLKHDRESHGVTRALVGIWRKDDRGEQIHKLLNELWQTGFGGRDGLTIPLPLGYWRRLNLLLTSKAPGRPLKQFRDSAEADWVTILRRVAAWLAKLHSSEVKAPRQFSIETELITLNGWLNDLIEADQPWLSHEKDRIETLAREIISQQQGNQQSQLCLTHGDFHLENILVRGATVTAIDFEHCVMGRPEMDLGYLIGQMDLQSVRYSQKRTGSITLNTERLANVLLEEYCYLRRTRAVESVPLYRARTYLNHLAHTVRMKGAESPQNVTLWLDKATACLEIHRSGPQYH